LGDLGFDVIHSNLHKTFSTPHGGGGPGAGPVCCSRALVPFLAAPVVSKDGNSSNQYSLVHPERSIGKISGFHGNFGVLVRAYTYIRTLGESGLMSISSNAVLNANYLMEALRDIYHLPYDRRCMHEVVFSADWQKERGVTGLEVAKRLLDYGYHAPTMYFPLIVHEALMIEPTESETRETLDAFIEAMRCINQESHDNPDLVQHAPYTTPVSRLDEAGAARRPDLRWRRDS
ncbi:MAG: aminomethyl-transferring glycine dehydrogenase subunit GcvPB, partial [Chloroflexota bacterium]|nr:aminomethyl-transferring glycine dehydrogenase subunit GcvPB [Chloroflexota bacterium]